MPGCSVEPPDEAREIVAHHGDTLLHIAIASIEHGQAHSAPLSPVLDRFDPALRHKRASFVTLRIAGELRGCIGKPRACNPLIADVAENAFGAAFEDSRFPALSAPEVDELDIEVSVLSDPTPLRFDGEDELMRQLRPGIDGVILEQGSHRGLFLPDVWKALPEPREFLAHLKVKAGLSETYWSNGVTALRFTTASVSRTRGCGAR